MSELLGFCDAVAMKQLTRKKTIYIVALLVLMSGVPIIPISKMVSNDPPNKMDERVKLQIVEEDLSKILTTIRGGRFISPAQVVLAKVGITRRLEPILLVEGLSTNEIGAVTVTTGFICGSLCGAGVNYVLYRENGEWAITRQSVWVS